MAECYNTVDEAQPNKLSNVVKTISILENKDLNETVYYTNKRDYVNEEWLNVTTITQSIASETATQLYKLFDSKILELKCLIQTATLPSVPRATNYLILASLNKEQAVTAKPSAKIISKPAPSASQH